MILFFTNPDLAATGGIAQYNTDAGCEYAIGVLGTQFDLETLASTDRKFFYSVEHQFPAWLVKEAKADTDINNIKLIKKYYDWVFSTSGLDLYPNYEDNQNVFYMNFSSLKQRIAKHLFH